MVGLLADINIQRQVLLVRAMLEGGEWSEIWRDLKLSVLTFGDVGLPGNASDATIWQLCQQRELVLVTGNRNKAGDDSLEATIRTHNTATALPVFTLGDPERVRQSRDYAHRVVQRALELLLDMEERYRGTVRLYIP